MTINDVKVMVGALGGFIASWFGGWTYALQAVLIFMFIDFILGTMNGVLQNSDKTPTGRLSSKVSWRGLCKKCTMMLFIIVAHNIDIAFSMTYVKDSVCVAIIVNELISIIENGKLMGVNIPFLTDVVETLNKKEGREV